VADMLDFGARSIAGLVDGPARSAAQSWSELLDRCLAAAGGLDGAAPASQESISRQHSAKPYVYDPVPRRDERFQDLWNQGVNPEAFLYNPDYPPRPKALMMLFKRVREIDVPEMMASIITQTKEKPGGYYQDIARQLLHE